MKTSLPVLLAALFAALTACSDGAADPPPPQQLPQQSGAAVPTRSPTAGVAAALPDFSSLVEQYGAAVVNVEVVQKVRQTRGPGGSSDDPLLDFFRRFGIPPPGGGGPGGEGDGMPERGAGSGFIVSDDGYILTNAHVVMDADEVTVRLSDRREFAAKVIGADERSDVALIKIDAQHLPTVRIGDPQQLRPGEWVLAIGSPFGLENSATAGIVSATSRAVGGESYVPFIQTDVAVNPGNSGGPLFNMRGEVVGMNSMIFSRTGGYMGLSFAVPIDVANDVREQLVKTGRVVRGRIGVGVQDMNAQLAQSFGLDRPRGALVSAVEDDSPAANAGITAGDVILSVNGHDIDRVGGLPTEIAKMKPGSKAELLVWREGKERTIDVRVAEMPQKEETRTADRREKADETERLGIAVRSLTPEEKRQVETDGSLVVEEVSGAAALAGVQPGDIILGVNGKTIQSVQQLRGAVKERQSTVALLIERGNAQIFIPIRVG
jgi:periplasmic serine protease, Do/DeqQ family